MVGLQPVRIVHHRAPPPNPYLTQFQAPNGSSVVSTDSSGENNDGNSNGSATTREYAQVLKSKGLNPRIKFNDRESEATTSTRESYVPSEGVSIEPGLPGPDNEEINSTATFKGNGTNENGQISTGVEKFDGRPIELITPPQIVADTQEEVDYVMGQTDNPILNAMSGEGILRSKNDY
jgi:hypothetical protein